MEASASEHDCNWKKEALAGRAELAEIRALMSPKPAVESPPSADTPRAAPDAALAADTLPEKIAELQQQNAALLRQLYSKKSEKRQPPIKQPTPKADPAVTQQKRRDNAALRDELPVDEIAEPLTPAQCACSKCGGVADKPLPSKTSEELDYVAGHFRIRRHVREVKACKCNETIVEAPVPARVQEKSPYTASVYAMIIAARICDSMPFYRLSKALKRQGVVISDRTLGDLYHRAADLLEALWKRQMQRIAEQFLVNADETPTPMQAPGKCKRAYMWTFLSGVLIGYRFSVSRSGQTPVAVLGGSSGTLVVDAYSGYNEVCVPEERERGGCLGHARRKFVESQSDDPIATAKALDLIVAVYRVEHEAKERGIVRSPAHLELRKTKSKLAMDAFKEWLDAERPRHLPKSPTGKAISYAINQWTPLTHFLKDPRIPIDNNAAEAALRLIALGRKNWLFVGHEESGKNLAILMTLVKSCQAVGVNPEEYLADVLMRVSSHPAARIDELLPDIWKDLHQSG